MVVVSKSESAVGIPPLEALLSDGRELAKARSQWQYGDWQSLIHLDQHPLDAHPDRAKLSLLVAAGHQQTGNHEAAEFYVRQSIQWGCDRTLVSRMLIAGALNTLARAAAAKGDLPSARRLFEEAVSTVTPDADVKLVAHARCTRELARLGLLEDALQQLESAAERPAGPVRRDAHAKVVDMEIDWLRERVLSLQRQHLVQAATSKAASTKSSTPTTATPSPDERRYYGLHGLDRKLEAYIDYDNGYFVELGANDGISQSNTCYFERHRNWRGVLIEPILHNFQQCRQSRSPENRYFCCACVSHGFDQRFVELAYSNLMTTPVGLETDIGDPLAHARSGEVYLREGEQVVPVLAPARTIDDILTEAQAPSVIDLLSLDVEGAEIEVLKGLDHSRFRFRFILVECRSPELLETYLNDEGYALVDRLSQHDFLFEDAHEAGRIPLQAARRLP
jgi:FkbM family methyltransferase